MERFACLEDLLNHYDAEFGATHPVGTGTVGDYVCWLRAMGYATHEEFLRLKAIFFPEEDSIHKPSQRAAIA